jgi:hypothetical protein
MQSQTQAVSQEGYKSYIQFATTLTELFDLDWEKYGSRIDSSWPFLNHIPSNAFKAMVQTAVDTWDGWPRNWTKAVKVIYELWRSGSKYSAVKYNKDEDFRYPVENMHEAFSILEHNGNADFIAFCKSTGMPENDIERVRCKLKYQTDSEFKRQVKLKINKIKQMIRSNIMPFKKETPRLPPPEYEDEVPF